MPRMEEERVAAFLKAATLGEGLLADATAYHLASGGSMWRARLATDCAKLLGIDDKTCVGLAAACELVHQASIVHDDVQDKASTRRDKPSVANRYGDAVAICVGDNLLVKAFGLLAPLPRAADLMVLFSNRVTEIVAGQAEEFSPDLWRRISRDRYHDLVAAKAGAMVSLPVEAASMLGGLSPHAVTSAGQAARMLGVIYQVSDDMADVGADLVRGSLNGVIAWSLDTGDKLRHDRLHALLIQAQRNRLSLFEAKICADGMAREAGHLHAWATTLWVEVSELLQNHPLSPVLSHAGLELRQVLDQVAERGRNAP